ncbi:hypothetical protein EDB86DRAFT_793592 [Lactarius hatsudake]|nr:hypothetical protein EDB86DRAFT_793592 [Lactarius hatsudake]
MDPLPFHSVNPFATFYPPQSAGYDVYQAQPYGDLDMAFYSSSRGHCQADLVTSSLYASEQSLYSGHPLLVNGVWHPGHAAAPQLSNTILQQQPQLEYAPQSPSILLHSPIPVSGASWPIISSDPSVSSENSYDQGTSPELKYPTVEDEPDLLQVYANAPRETFPTPSELLNKATSRHKSVNTPAKPGRKPEKKVETQRKALQRVLEESIGFSPTDPDTISSHDKKRYYLECLEQYITYLHDQLRLVGHDPVPLERVSTYRGLTSRSIRTMLVNTQNVLKKTHDETIAEEENFLKLRDQVLSLDFQNQPPTGYHELPGETKLI